MKYALHFIGQVYLHMASQIFFIVAVNLARYSLSELEALPSGAESPPLRAGIEDGVEPEAAKLIFLPNFLYPPSEICYAFHGEGMSSPFLIFFIEENMA